VREAVIRLIVPLFVLTAVSWLIIYAATRRARREGLHTARQLLVSLGLAALVLGAVSALFYFGGSINVR
jgi:cytochrome c oxidase assembly factor CtaG